MMNGPVQGTAVVLLLRESGPLSFTEVSRSLGWDPDDYSSAYVRSKLRELERAGLILHSDEDVYQISPNWADIQQALGISLTQIRKLGPRSLVVQPMMGPPDTLSQTLDVFVVMPFEDRLRPVWDDHIKSVTTSLGLTAFRADDFFTSHEVMRDVWNAVYNSRVVMADCTGRNPNVFYEIGLAHVVGKPVILITQDGNDVPFDLRSYRYIEYEYTPRGMQDFESALSGTLTETL